VIHPALFLPASGCDIGYAERFALITAMLASLPPRGLAGDLQWVADLRRTRKLPKAGDSVFVLFADDNPSGAKWWEGRVETVHGSPSAASYKFRPTGKGGKPSRTKVSLNAHHSHVHYIKDNTDHAVLFNPERYQKNRVYKPVQPAWRFSRDMLPSVAASSRHVSSDNDGDSSGFAS
jgi:hypothetical protein